MEIVSIIIGTLIGIVSIYYAREQLKDQRREKKKKKIRKMYFIKY